MIRLPFAVLVIGGLLSCGTLIVAEDWPQWRGPQRDGVWRETGIVEKFKEDELPIKWRAKIPSGYTGPTVAAGKVYLTDRVTEAGESRERILCFDEQTGEEAWIVSYPCEYGRVGYAAGPRACVTIDAGKARWGGTLVHDRRHDGTWKGRQG